MVDVQEWACHALWYLARNLGNMKLIAAVQQRACSALHNLFHNSGNRASIAATAGIDAILAAMRNHAAVASLQESLWLTVEAGT